MGLTTIESLIIVSMVVLGTLITKYLPFILFKGDKSNNTFISYLGQVLPYSAIGLLAVYCLKDISFRVSPHGLPELIAILGITIIHLWKKSTLLSIGVGTITYMILVQYVFI